MAFAQEREHAAESTHQEPDVPVAGRRAGLDIAKYRPHVKEGGHGRVPLANVGHSFL